MRKWRNHQVTADVGVQIEDDEIVSAPMEHEILFIVGWILLRGAENAGGGLRHIGSARGDISMSPATPESFHNSLIRDDSPISSLRSESLAILSRRYNSLDHLSIGEITVELIQLAEPEVVAGVIRIR